MWVFLVLNSVVVVLILILYARWNYGILEAMHIPVVKPHFLLGSTYNAHNEVGGEADLRRFKKYGSIYGVCIAQIILK